MTKLITCILAIFTMMPVCGQETIKSETLNADIIGLKRVYDESIDPLQQIDQAIAKAKAEHKNVICQVGGNWCPWCLRFAAFVTNDNTISKVIADNYVYIHVNYNHRRSAGEEATQQAKALMDRLNHPDKYGFPVFVVLNDEGTVLHIQDSGVLEEGKSYNKEKVLHFFNEWKPMTCETINAMESEMMPRFPGGDTALTDYLYKNIQYPALASQYGVEGKVIMTFNVETDGKITNINCARSYINRFNTTKFSQETESRQKQLKEQFALLFAKEAARVIRNMPEWKPGMQDGKPIRVKYTIPVSFSIPNK